MHLKFKKKCAAVEVLESIFSTIKKERKPTHRLCFYPFSTSQNHIALLFHPLMKRLMSLWLMAEGWNDGHMLRLLKPRCANSVDSGVIKPVTSPVKSDYKMSSGLFVFH